MKEEFIDLLSMDDIPKKEDKKVIKKEDKNLEKKEKDVEINNIENILLDKRVEPTRITSVEKATEEKVEKKKRRRYIKYENGRFMYLYTEGEEEPVKNKIKDFFKKDTNKRVIIEEAKANFDLKSSLNTLLTIFLILSLVFVYFYYIRDTGSAPIIKEPIVNEGPKAPKPLFDFINKGKEEEDKKGSDKEIEKDVEKDVEKIVIEPEKMSDEDVKEYTKEMSASFINRIEQLSKREDQRVLDYMDLKGNRKALISTITGIKKEKETVYVDFAKNREWYVNNEELLKETENYIVRNIIKSESLLKSLIGTGGNSALENILNNY